MVESIYNSKDMDNNIANAIEHNSKVVDFKAS